MIIMPYVTLAIAAAHRPGGLLVPRKVAQFFGTQQFVLSADRIDGLLVEHRTSSTPQAA